MSPERTVALQDLYNVMDALTRVPFKNEALEEARLRVREKLDAQQALVPARLRAERIADWIRASIREMPIVEELRDILAQNQNEGAGGDGSFDEYSWNAFAEFLRHLDAL